MVCALGWNLQRYVPPAGKAAVDPSLARQEAASRAFYPLTLPVTVDAGAIAVAITVGANHGQTLQRDIVHIAAAAAAAGAAVIAVVLLLVYRYAGRVNRWLGEQGMEVVLRLSALLVLSIGVQIVWNGVKSLLGELPAT